MATTPAELVGRFPVTGVQPVSVRGTRPAAGAVGEQIPISATIFREGHDAVNADVRWIGADPTDTETVRMTPRGDGLDTWDAHIRPRSQGLGHYVITAWGDPWHTWTHRAQIKIPAGVDVDVELAEGAGLLKRAAAELPRSASVQRATLRTAARAMASTKLPAAVRLAAGTDPAITAILHTSPLRDGSTECGPWPILVQRRRALVGSWYEFFPRSEGATAKTSGTFATAAQRLHDIAEMGFDVVYLPPIHPIGETFRKGPNNTLNPGTDDPGSPWAIGSAAGGHDSVHPDLGTMADFDAFVTQANALGLEIALDLALQAAPDHPWVATHPEWFTTRADGTIAYAENPPKKYQDIYPLNFDNDPEGLYAEVERIVRHWVSHGVNIFRVDNPHTKPLWVWERLIARVNADHPDVLFLAEAFTRPAMMAALAQVGFQQSYTYFTWRNDAAGLRAYATEIAGPSAAYMRPNFFVNTPDILSEYLQTGGPSAFAIRAVLASTLAPTYGVYSGFELYEHVPIRPGSEEYLDSEKYQFRPRDWDLARKQHRTMAPFLTQLNRIRHQHPALQDLRSLRFHDTDNPNLLAFTKRDGNDVIAVVCTVDPHHQQQGTIWWDMRVFDRDISERFVAHDLLSDVRWTWDQATYVELRPWEQVAHIVHVGVDERSNTP